jgi:hypothetical protein
MSTTTAVGGIAGTPPSCVSLVPQAELSSVTARKNIVVYGFQHPEKIKLTAMQTFISVTIQLPESISGWLHKGKVELPNHLSVETSKESMF